MRSTESSATEQSQLPEALPVGHEISLNGTHYTIDQQWHSSASERRYLVSDPTQPQRHLVLRQRLKPQALPSFEREVACLREVNKLRRVYLLPEVLAHGEHNGEERLVQERLLGPTLEERRDDLADEGLLLLSFEQVLLAISKVHRAGYVITDLSPSSFVWAEDDSLQLTELSNLTPIGDRPLNPTRNPYSAPELSKNLIVDERLDIFSVVAMFLEPLLGVSLSEPVDYVEFASKTPLVKSAIAQIVSGALTDLDIRFLSINEIRTLFYQLKNERARFPRPVAATASTSGISRHRYINEDSTGFQELAFQYQSRPYHLGFYCVADGMGGHDLGERASQLAVLGGLQAFRQLTQEVSMDRLVANLPEFTLAIARIAAEVVANGAQQLGGLSRMGTTFTGVLVVNQELALCHVGDSRALLIRAGEVIRLSQDHSLVAAMVRAGQMSEAEAEASNEKNILVRCIDALTPMDEADFDSLTAEGFADGRLVVESGDCIVLLSDGVWGALSQDQLREIVVQGADPRTTAESIVQAALGADSDDNSTVLVIRWH